MEDPKKVIKPFYIFIPVTIGLSVVLWLFFREFNPEIFANIQFSGQMAVGLFLAFLFMSGRDFGLIWRFRMMSDKILTWKQAFKVNMLCEFTSAVTPSAVGGSALIVLFLNKEGINAAKSTAIMMACLFMDELFLVIACPILLAIFPLDKLFGETTIITTGVKTLFFIVYGLITLWTLILYIALFRKPHWVQIILLKLFSGRFLRRWKPKVEIFTDNLVTSSKELGKRGKVFWAKTFGTTCLSWCSRYLVVNALLLAFTSSGDHFLAFARQFVLWIIMLVSPTPGGSGVSEYMFSYYYADFVSIAGLALVIAFTWRIVTYYTYLIIGAIIIPSWIKKFK